MGRSRALSLWFFTLAPLLWVAFAQPVRAEPFELDVNSLFPITLGLGGEEEKLLSFSGEDLLATVRIEDHPSFGPVATALRFDRGGPRLPDVYVYSYTVTIFELEVQITDVVSNLGWTFSPAVLPAIPSGPGTSTVDLEPVDLVLDWGTLVRTTVPPVDDRTIHFSQTPATFDLSQDATVEITVGADGIPSMRATLALLDWAHAGVGPTISLEGDLVLDGEVSVNYVPALPPVAGGAAFALFVAAGVGVLRRRMGRPHPQPTPDA